MATSQILIEIKVISQQINAINSQLRAHASALRAATVANKAHTASVTASSSAVGSLFSKLGGFAAGIRATSGVLRALGTAGFLVGGQFRTLGFALSAASSLLQNFGPLILNIATQLGPLGLAITGVATFIGVNLFGSLAVAAGELGIFSLALYEVVKAGFEFNSEYEKAAVSIGALVDQLFFLKDASGKVLEGQAALNGGIQIADEQLQKLRIDALQTVFTFKQLFTVLQAGVAASAGTKGSLDDIRKAVVGLTQLAAARGIPAEQLGTSITQALLGTLRVTNRLKSTLADVFGVNNQDVNKYIQKLRVQGTLFDELNRKLVIFNLAGSAQAKTFTGIVNNLQDAFQIFSAAATKPAFDTIKTGLSQILAFAFDFKNSDFTPPLRQVIEILKPLLNLIAKDLVKAVQFILGKAVEFASALERNENELTVVYEKLKLIGLELFNATASTLKILGISTDWESSLSTISKWASAIAFTFALIADTLNAYKTLAAGLIVQTLQLALYVAGIRVELVKTFEAATSPAKYFAGIHPLTDQAKKDFQELAKTTLDWTTTFNNDLKNLGANLTDLRDRMDEINAQKSRPFFDRAAVSMSDADLVQSLNFSIQQKLQNKNQTQDEKNLTDALQAEFDRRNVARVNQTTAELGERKRLDDALKSSKADNRVSELAADNALAAAKRTKADQLAQELLKLTQDRLKNEEEVLKNQLDDQLISISDYYTKLKGLRNQDYSEQIKVQEQLAQDARKKNAEDNAALNQDRDRLIDNAKRAKIVSEISTGSVSTDPDEVRKAAQEATNNATIESERLQSQLNVIETKRATALVQMNTTIQASEKAIQLIRQQAPEETAKLTREELLQKQVMDDTILSYKELQLAIDDDTVSQEAFNAKIRDFIAQNKTAILELQRRARAAGDPKLILDGKPHLKSTEASDAEKALSLLNNISSAEVLRLTIEQRLDKIEVSRVTFVTQEARLQEQISSGLIGQVEGNDKLIDLHRQQAKELSKQVDYFESLIQATEFLNDNRATPETIKARQQLQELRLEIFKLSQVTETVLIKASEDARASFTTLFDELISGTVGVKQAFSNLALSILASFRKLLADKIVKDLFGEKGIFGKLLAPESQTSGAAGGFFSKFLRSIGLDPNSEKAKLNGKFPEISKNARDVALDPLLLNNISAMTAAVARIDQRQEALKVSTPSGIVTTSNPTAVPIGSVNNPVIGTPTSSVITAGVPNTAATAGIDSGVGAIGDTKISVIDFGTGAHQYLNAIIRVVTGGHSISDLWDDLGHLNENFTKLAGIVEPIQDIRTAVDNINTLIGTLNETIGTFFDDSISSVVSAINSAGGGGSDDSGGLSGLEQLFSDGGFSGVFNSGGYLRGPGSTTSDSIPALLSDKEYVVKAAAVKKYGVGFMDQVNSMKFAGGGFLSNIFGSSGFLSKIFGGGGSKSGGLLTAFLPFLVGMLGGKKSKITGSLLSILGLYYNKKNKKADGGLIQHFGDGSVGGVGLIHELGHAGSSGGGGFLSSQAGGSLISAGISIGLALLGRLFAKKAPKTDPNRTIDPYGLNPDTLTFYKHPIIKGVRNYLAQGGLVTGQSIAGSMQFAQGGLATSPDQILSGIPDIGNGSPSNFHQTVNITTPDLHTFRKSKQTIARELGKMAQRGLAGRRSRV